VSIPDNENLCVAASEARATSLFQKNVRSLPPLHRWVCLRVSGVLEVYRRAPRSPAEQPEFSLNLKRHRVSVADPAVILKADFFAGVAPATFILDPLSPADGARGVLETSPGLGLVLMFPAGLGRTWKFELFAACARAEERDKKRSRFKRWMHRGLLRAMSGLSSADFDESKAEEFQSVVGEPYQPVLEFSSFEEYLRADEISRHCTPPSRAEFESVFDFVGELSESSPGWGVCTQREGVYAIKSLDPESGIIRVKTVGQLPGVPPQVAFHCSYDAQTRASWDVHFVFFRSEAARTPVSPGIDIIHAAVHAPVVSDREFLEWRMLEAPPAGRPEHSGGFRMYLRSCDFSDAPEVGKGRVRADVLASAYEISWQPDGKGCQLVIYSQVDIKGSIPKFVINSLAPSTPLKWVKKLRSACAEFMSAHHLSVSDSDAKLDEVCNIKLGNAM